MCKLCSKPLKSAGPQRLFDHIRGGSVDVTACPGPGDDVENADAKQKAFRELRKKLVEEHEAKQKAAAQKAQRQHALEDLRNKRAAEEDAAAASASKNQTTLEGMKHVVKQKLDRQFARFFYNSGVPLHIADDPELDRQLYAASC